MMLLLFGVRLVTRLLGPHERRDGAVHVVSVGDDEVVSCAVDGIE